MLLTFSEISMLVREKQLKKAKLPIDVTFSGIFIFERFSHKENALLPIIVNFSNPEDSKV